MAVDIWTTAMKSLRIDEVAAALGVSRRTVYYWVEKHNVRSAPGFWAHTRIPIEDVQKIAVTLGYLTPPTVQSKTRSA